MNLVSILSTLAGKAISGSDNSLGQILASLAGTSGQSETNILNIIMSAIQQQGGVGTVLEQFKQNGLASKPESWVSTNPNEELEPAQVEQVLGSSVVNSVAAKLGVAPGKAGSIIAAVLPELINQITPDGILSGRQDDVISKGLALLSKL